MSTTSANAGNQAPRDAAAKSRASTTTSHLDVISTLPASAMAAYARVLAPYKAPKNIPLPLTWSRPFSEYKMDSMPDHLDMIHEIEIWLSKLNLEINDHRFENATFEHHEYLLYKIQRYFIEGDIKKLNQEEINNIWTESLKRNNIDQFEEKSAIKQYINEWRWPLLIDFEEKSERKDLYNQFAVDTLTSQRDRNETKAFLLRTGLEFQVYNNKVKKHNESPLLFIMDDVEAGDYDNLSDEEFDYKMHIMLRSHKPLNICDDIAKQGWPGFDAFENVVKTMFANTKWGTMDHKDIADEPFIMSAIRLMVPNIIWSRVITEKGAPKTVSDLVKKVMAFHQRPEFTPPILRKYFGIALYDSIGLELIHPAHHDKVSPKFQIGPQYNRLMSIDWNFKPKLDMDVRNLETHPPTFTTQKRVVAKRGAKNHKQQLPHQKRPYTEVAGSSNEQNRGGEGSSFSFKKGCYNHNNQNNGQRKWTGHNNGNDQNYNTGQNFGNNQNFVTGNNKKKQVTKNKGKQGPNPG